MSFLEMDKRWCDIQSYEHAHRSIQITTAVKNLCREFSLTRLFLTNSIQDEDLLEWGHAIGMMEEGCDRSRC
jgi:hypothetical protein